MAMQAGATYVCPLVGRLQDQGHDALALVQQCVDAVDLYCQKMSEKSTHSAGSRKNDKDHNAKAKNDFRLFGQRKKKRQPTIEYIFINVPTTIKSAACFLKN